MTHGGAYAACPDTSSWRPATRTRRGPGARVAAYADPARLLAEARPELVSVATPDATHAALLELCLRADGVRGVLAEKPLALDVAAARALVALARRTRRRARRQLHAPLRPRFRASTSPRLGALQHVSGSYAKGLAHNGTHWLDLLRMLAGEPVAVRAWDRLREPGDDPTLDAELTLAGGAGVRLAGLDTRRFTAFEMELTGTLGRIRIAESGHVIERYAIGDDARYPGYRVLVPVERVTAAMRDGTLHAVRDLSCVACVRAASPRVPALTASPRSLSSRRSGSRSRAAASDYAAAHDRASAGQRRGAGRGR